MGFQMSLTVALQWQRSERYFPVESSLSAVSVGRVLPMAPVMPSFFRCLVIEASDAAGFPDVVRRLRREEVQGILVRGLYGAEECRRLVSRFEAGAGGLPRNDFPPLMHAYFLGMNLNLAPPDLDPYFCAVPEFRCGLRALFTGSVDLETRVAGLLSMLDEGRRYRAAPGPQPDADHMFTTIRAHLTGGFIPPHFDNEQRFRVTYRYITPQIGADLFSYVLTFSAAETGGELEVFDARQGGRSFRMADGAGDASRLDLAGVESARFRLNSGEMLVFNSGRYLHRVTPVVGATTRWTACSFMAESRADDQVYCWG